MKIIKAEHLGMCFGVRDAIALARETAAHQPLTILGDLVHNETVLGELRARGIQIEQKPESIGTRAQPAPSGATADVVINTTPLGLRAADPLPAEPRSLAGVRAALDLVYAAGGTPWVRALTEAGLRAADGREVLVQQGAAAFARFFPDQRPPLEVMRAAVARALSSGG